MVEAWRNVKFRQAFVLFEIVLGTREQPDNLLRRERAGVHAHVVENAVEVILPDVGLTFRQDDPNTWRAPLPDERDIAAGKSLWESAPLTLSPLNPAPMKATCADCHAADGYDLKYFSFSTLSI